MSDSSSGVDSSSAEEDEDEEGSEVSGEVQEESTVPFNEDSFIEGSMMEAFIRPVPRTTGLPGAPNPTPSHGARLLRHPQQAQPLK